METYYYTKWKNILIAAVLLLRVINAYGQCVPNSDSYEYNLDTASVITNRAGYHHIRQTTKITTNTITVAPTNACMEIIMENVNILSFRIPLHIQKFNRQFPGQSESRSVNLKIIGKNTLTSREKGNASIQIDGPSTELSVLGSSNDTLIVSGGESAAGIGAGNNDIQSGTATFFGGFIDARGGANAAGIGTSARQPIQSINFYGGVVSASYIGQGPGSINEVLGMVRISRASVKLTDTNVISVAPNRLQDSITSNRIIYLCRILNKSGTDSVIIDDHTPNKKAFKLGANHYGDNALHLYLPRMTTDNAEYHTITTVLKNGIKIYDTARWNTDRKWDVYSFHKYMFQSFEHQYDGLCPSWEEVWRNIFIPSNVETIPFSPPEANVSCNAITNAINFSTFNLSGISAFGNRNNNTYRIVKNNSPTSKNFTSKFESNITGIVDTFNGNKIVYEDGQEKKIKLTAKNSGLMMLNPLYIDINGGSNYNSYTPPSTVGAYVINAQVNDAVSSNYFTGGNPVPVDTIYIMNSNWDTMQGNTSRPLYESNNISNWEWVNGNTIINCTGVQYYPIKERSGSNRSVIGLRGISLSGTIFDLSSVCPEVHITRGGTYRIIQMNHAAVNKRIIVDVTDSVTINIENLNIEYGGAQPVIDIVRNNSRVGINFKGTNRLTRTRQYARSTIISPAGAGSRVSLTGRFSQTDYQDNDYLIITDKSEQNATNYTDTIGTFIINNGIIEAKSERGTAALGSAKGGTAQGVIINGGRIRASGRKAAGIGSGTPLNTIGSNCKEIVINGGYLIATTDSAGGQAAIGTGADGRCDTITINGGLVKANTTNAAKSALGNSGSGNYPAIRINGGSVEARSSAGAINSIYPQPQNKEGKGVYLGYTLTEENVKGVYFEGKPINIWGNHLEHDSLYLYLPYRLPEDDNKLVDVSIRQGRGVARCTAAYLGTRFNYTCQTKNAASRLPTQIAVSSTRGFNLTPAELQANNMLSVSNSIMEAAPLQNNTKPITANLNEYIVKFRDSVILRGTIDNDSLPSINIPDLNLRGLGLALRHPLSVEYGGSYLRNSVRYDTSVIIKYSYNYSIPPALSAVYGDTLKSLSLRLNETNRETCRRAPLVGTDPACFENWYWHDSAALVGNAGVNQHRAHFRYAIPAPSLAGLYYELDTMISVSVARKYPQYEAPPAQTAIYGTLLRNIYLGGYVGWQWVREDSLPEVGTFRYPAQYIPPDAHNYYSPIDSSIAVSVRKADTTAAVPSFTAVYGDTLKSINFADAHWHWAAPNTILSEVGELRLRARFIPTDSAHYNLIDTMIDIRVSKKMPTYPTPHDLVAFYGDTLANIALPQGWRWMLPSVRADTLHIYVPEYDIYRDSVIYVRVDSRVGAAGVHIYPAAYWQWVDTAFDTVHYFPIDSSLELTVRKTNPHFVLPTGLIATYGQMLREVYWGANNWTWKENATATPVGSAGVQRHMAIYIDPDTNYWRVDTVVEVNVGKAKPANITLPSGLEGVYGDALSIIVLDGGWAWLDPAALVGEVTPYSRYNYHPAVFTPSDNFNYDTLIRNLPVSVISQEVHLRNLIEVSNADTFGNPRYFRVNTCNINEITVKFFPSHSIRNILCKNKTLSNPGDTLHLDVLRPSVYALPFEVEYYSGDRRRDTIHIERRFEIKDIVYQKFEGKLLIVNNNFERNNGYEFTSYKWYKYDDLAEIYDEMSSTQQCCDAKNGETDSNNDGFYYLEMTYTDPADKKEKTITTCKGEITAARKPKADLLAYPVPASGSITVENIHWQADNYIKIITTGNSVIQNYKVGSDKETLDISMIAPGAYFLWNDNRYITIVIR